MIMVTEKRLSKNSAVVKTVVMLESINNALCTPELLKEIYKGWKIPIQVYSDNLSVNNAL